MATKKKTDVEAKEPIAVSDVLIGIQEVISGLQKIQDALNANSSDAKKSPPAESYAATPGPETEKESVKAAGNEAAKAEAAEFKAEKPKEAETEAARTEAVGTEAEKAEAKRAEKAEVKKTESDVKYTTEDVRGILANAAHSGHKAEVIQILHDHGAQNITQLKEGDYADVVAKARVLTDA